MTSAILSSIRVNGEDAKSFLQGQLSNDLDRLDNEAEILAAWCTPKGRVITTFRITGSASEYRLALPSELAENVVKRLIMFRFRAKVEFEIETETSTLDLNDSIAAGIPCIGTQQTEKFTPHMLNLDLLDAIDFNKGCYTGQEIVARTHYKGATKRRTLRFTSEQPVAVGDKISDGTRDIGEVLNASNQNLLAVLPIDKANAELSIKNIQIAHQPLPYLPN